MNIKTILCILLVCVGVVLFVVAVNLYRIKRREDDLLSRKTYRQVNLMRRHSFLSALL